MLRVDKLFSNGSGHIINRLLYGTLWSFAGSVISKGLALVSSVFVARLLGKNDFGVLGIIQSSIAMFGTIAGLGLGVTATKYVAENIINNKDKAGRVIVLVTTLSALSGLFMMCGMYLCADVIAEKSLNAPQLGEILRVSAPLLLFSTFAGAQNGVLAGLESFKSIAFVNLISGIANFPIILIGAHCGGVHGAVYGLVLSSVILCLLNYLKVKQELDKKKIFLVLQGFGKEWDILWRFSLPALIGGVLVAPVTWLCNVMLVNTSNGFAEMGIYSAANQWFNVLFFLPGILGTAILPVLSERIGDNDSVSSGKLLSTAIWANLLIVLPLVLLISLFSKTIMGSYGEDFSGSWPVLIVSCLTAGLVALQSPVGHIITATDKMWLGLLMNIAWGIVLLISTHLLVQKGALGMALARLIAYAFHSVWTLIYARCILKRMTCINRVKCFAKEVELAGS